MVLLRVSAGGHDSSHIVSIEDDASLRSSLQEIVDGLNLDGVGEIAMWIEDKYSPNGQKQLDQNQTPRELKLAQFTTLMVVQQVMAAPSSPEPTAPHGNEVLSPQKIIAEEPSGAIELHATRAASGMQSLTLQELVRSIVDTAAEAGTLHTVDDGSVDAELLERVFALMKHAATIKTCAVQIRRLQAAGQSELLLDLAGFVSQKQLAAQLMLDIVVGYFLGKRVVPVGPMDAEYAGYIQSLTHHHQLMRFAEAERVQDDAGYSEVIDTHVYNTIRIHLPPKVVVGLVQASALPA